MSRIKTFVRHVLVALLAATLTACGGGNNDAAAAPPASLIPTHKVGGSAAGLTGTGLILQNNAGDDLAIAVDGVFMFSTAIPEGAPYAVAVRGQPASPTQTCSVNKATGIVGAADVTDVAVVCSTSSFELGGTVVGLAGGGLVLQNAGVDLPVSANGSFAFQNALASGASYAVTVKTQPSGPTQVCSVDKASGTMSASNIMDLRVTCATSSFKVGGNVNGLTGTGLVLQNNAGDDLPVTASGPFHFAQPVASGSTYAVTVKTQPLSTPPQTCSVSAASGAVTNTNVSTAVVTCATATFAVGGTVSGLDGVGLVLQNNAGDDFNVTADGAFVFARPVASGATYSVTVKTQPALLAQTCTVSNANGTVAVSPVTNVTVTCISPFGHLAFVTNAIDSTISAYLINTSVRQLQRFSPVVTGLVPDAIAVHSLFEVAYVSNPSGSGVSTFSIFGGVVRFVDFTAMGGLPGPLAIDPAGAFLYVVDTSSAEIRGFSIAPNGLLTPAVSPVQTGPTPRGVVLDPTGRFAYVASQGSNAISSYTVNAVSGALTAIPSATTTGSPTAIAADPSGKYIYVTSVAPSVAQTFAINQATGNLTPVGVPVTISANSASLAVHPKGTINYAGNLNDANVSQNVISQATGALTALAPAALSVSPTIDMKVDPTGHYLYVLNIATLTAYELDPVSGEIGLAWPSVPTGLGPAGLALAQ